MTYLIRRFVAYYIDGCIGAIISFAIILVKNIIQGISFLEMDNPSMGNLFATQLLITIGYFVVFEFFNGATIGKKIMKFSIEGLKSRLSFSRFLQVLCRTLMRLVPIEPFSIFFNEERVMWHDNVSKTKVIDKRNAKL